MLSYTYTGEGNLYSITATENGSTTKYIYGYDSNDRLIYSERKINDVTDLRTRQYYDGCSRLMLQTWQMGESVYSESFTYNSDDYTWDSSWDDGALETMVIREGIEGTPFISLTMGYDELRRLSTVTGGVADKTYTYRDITSSNTTTQVASVTYDLPTDQSYSYTYDSMGNIATYTDSNGTVTYTYDAQNQLLSAVNGDTTYAYTYDTVGNILTANGHTYTYGDADWKDLLTKVDGQTIEYDAIGNPIEYYNGTEWEFTWSNGRQLTTATAGDTNLSFTYDADGLRTSKTVDGITHNYLYASGKLLRESYGNNVLDFFYDASGNAYALKHNGTLYYYITNLQGDVMSIVDETGTPVATYEYDPYGNVITATGTLAEVNPIRYRGYYYDSESGFYYLQSRYYDPEVGRFINADNYVSTGWGLLGYNTFAYCNNNPIVMVDSCGRLPEMIDEDPDNRPDITDEENGGPAGVRSNGPSIPGNAPRGGTTPNGGNSNNNSGTQRYEFKSDAALNEHYAKHNGDFGNDINSPQEYVDTANYVIQNGEYVSQQNAYVRFYGMNGRANYAFVGMNREHTYITTFHIRPVGQIYFDVI